MAELKTKSTDESVMSFLDRIEDKHRREDAYTILQLLKKCSKSEPKMWGPNIIGFGKHHLVYESGRELDWFLIGLSPRKQNFVIYFIGSYITDSVFLPKLGKCKTGKGCLYINRLYDVDLKVLEQMVNDSLTKLKSK